MEDLHRDPRPCAHCGGEIAADDTTCAGCGRVYIPDPPLDDARPVAGPSIATDGPSSPPARIPDEPLAAPARSRDWAMGAHVSALAGALLGGLPSFLGPLVIWLLRRDEHDPFASEHARQALNFNLSVIIYAIAALLLSIVTLGLALLVVIPIGLFAFVGYIVVTIRATMAASRGERYRYPLTIALVR